MSRPLSYKVIGQQNLSEMSMETSQLLIETYFGLSQDEVIKLEGSVYGLRTAPKAWFTRVAKDPKALGAKQHPLDQCVFMFYSPDNTMLGALGVYVDDFLFAESDHPEWTPMMSKVKALYSWGQS